MWETPECQRCHPSLGHPVPSCPPLQCPFGEQEQPMAAQPRAVPSEGKQEQGLPCEQHRCPAGGLLRGSVLRRKRDGAVHRNGFTLLSSNSLFQWAAVGVRVLCRGMVVRMHSDGWGCLGNA